MAANLLHLETSPYLLQHANNPVNWQAWSEEAFIQAGKEQKLIILSIGYAACHWCHVMEHESFSDAEVAQIMNQNYVCIKVDREEHPEIDHIYMDAIQLINGQGGWPLNCFLLPNKMPFYGGTYFAKENWKDVLMKIQELYKSQPHALIRNADEIKKGVEQHLNNFHASQSEFSHEISKNVWGKIKPQLDFVEGGLKHAPKFPMPVVLNMLLQYAYHFKSQETDDFIKLTLDKMAMGGIYDQIEGGFSRYSTDEFWKVPHFEKMLYDNAQLISVYAHAYQKYKDPLFKKVVYETIGFVKNELTSTEGGFYASIDADSEGEEGKYYVWEYDEFKNSFGESGQMMASFYHVIPEGNWEGNNILFRKEDEKSFAEKNHIELNVFEEYLKESKRLLSEKRKKRIPPITDQKIITSWNALMLKALIDAYRVFNDEDFLEMALKNADFIKTHLYDENVLQHVYRKPGSKQISGFLDDYAFTADAFICLYEASLDEKYLFFAKKLSEYVLLHFKNEKLSMFSYTDSETEKLFAQPMEIYDNVMPSSNSVMANTLFKLGVYFENTNYYQSTSKNMLLEVIDKAEQFPQAFANWYCQLFRFSEGSKEIKIKVANPKTVREELDCYYFPDMIIMGEISSNKNQPPEAEGIYLCKKNTCFPATTKVEELIEMIKT